MFPDLGSAWLPSAAPLAHPVQDLKTGKLAPIADAPRMARRRALLLSLTFLMTLGASLVMERLLASGGLTGLEGVALALFAILFGWIAFAFVAAAAGFVTLWRRPALPTDILPVITRRTALLMPTYNEDPGRIVAAIQAMVEDLQRLGVAPLYDVFVLSDTRDEKVAETEAVAVLRLKARLGPDVGLYYRRRGKNTDRKAGNVSDWVARFGGAYDFMLVLDADSLMSAETMLRLTAEMEADAGLGLLQTAPAIVGAETTFARAQQFAAGAFGGMVAAGQDWWSGAEGNYWGHNAILRTRAFAAHAGLPNLPGAKPFGGHILSHDFVEAALLRRAGWKARLAVGLEGSYEETPPTILDMAIRDRRWCQGNLQHAGVIGASGLHWVNRLHMARGILSYVTAPLWLFMLLAGAGVWVQQTSAPLMISGQPAVWLFGLTMAMLIIPKLLAGALAARRPQAFGGQRRLWLSIGVEIVLSALIAPVMMLMQSVAVFDVLLGRDSGWSSQSRDPGRMSRKEAWRAHGAHVGIGLIGSLLALALDPALLWWASPVYLGLILSAPLSLMLSHPTLGRAIRALGVFATPEERAPPAIVARAAELRAAYDRDQALRWRIDRLMSQPVAVYEVTKTVHRPAFNWARPAPERKAA